MMPTASTKRRTATRSRKKRAPKRTAPRSVVPTIPDAREVWLAGLGVFVAAGETSTWIFEELVRRGRIQDPKIRARARNWVRQARRSADGLASDALEGSRRTFDQVLERLGVEERPRNRNILHRLGDIAEALL